MRFDELKSPAQLARAHRRVAVAAFADTMARIARGGLAAPPVFCDRRATNGAEGRDDRPDRRPPETDPMIARGAEAKQNLPENQNVWYCVSCPSDRSDSMSSLSAGGEFFIWNRRNPLKSLDSDE
jgi:hypothetical protein